MRQHDGSGENPRQAEPARHYVVLTPPDLLRRAYERGEPRLVEEALRRVLSQAGEPPMDRIAFRVRGLPSLVVRLPPPPSEPRQTRRGGRAAAAAVAGPSGPDAAERGTTARIIIPLAFPDTRARDLLVEWLGKAPGVRDLAAGIDLPIAPTDQHWCPGEATLPLFGDRPAAERLIHAAGLGPPRGGGSSLPVNLVIVDQGLRAGAFSRADATPIGIPAQAGLPDPFMATGRHGSMVARNALSLVRSSPQQVRLFDVPLLPERIIDLRPFLSTANAVYVALLDHIEASSAASGRPEAWVLVNAWGVYDRTQDLDDQYNYGKNPAHPLNAEMTRASRIGADVVFAAGNCGQFCPSARCGPNDYGPGRSIHGANAHPDVLTVGAVRTDGLWLGYASQGPGMIAPGKPDLCAPSGFAEVGDSSAYGSNTGSSAACGMAAGVVAALRGLTGPDAVSPAELRDVLRNTAWRPAATPAWDGRRGHGVIQAGPARAALPGA